MIRIQGPGNDFASQAHADAANNSGHSYFVYLEHNRRYCLAQADMFQSALDEYLGVDHDNATEFNKTNPGV